MDEDVFCEISKTTQEASPCGTILLSKSLTVKGNKLKEAKKVFDELWRKE